jgi:hypothetical protein
MPSEESGAMQARFWVKSAVETPPHQIAAYTFAASALSK